MPEDTCEQRLAFYADHLKSEVLGASEHLEEELRRGSNSWWLCFRTRVTAVKGFLEAIKDYTKRNGLKAVPGITEEELGNAERNIGEIVKDVDLIHLQAIRSHENESEIELPQDKKKELLGKLVHAFDAPTKEHAHTA